MKAKDETGVNPMELMERPVVFKSDANVEVSLSPGMVKRFVAKGNADKVTMQEAVSFVQLCRYNRLNPFIGDAFLIKYGDEATMVVAKYVYTKRARKSPDFDGYTSGVIVVDKESDERPRKPIYREGLMVFPGEALIGGWSEVYIKGISHPLKTEAPLDEFIGKNKRGEVTKMWKEKTATMIRKCALVGGLREAFGEETGTLPDQDEILGAEDVKPEPNGMVDLTPKEGGVWGAMSPPPPPEDTDEGEGPPEPPKAKTPEPPKPKAAPKKRSRRNKIVVNGETITSAGITGPTMEKVKTLEKDLQAEGSQIVDRFLGDVGYKYVSFLREDEGRALLEQLRAAAMGPEVTQEPEEVPNGGLEAANADKGKSFFCAEKEGRVYPSVCEKNCDRNKPPKVCQLYDDEKTKRINERLKAKREEIKSKETPLCPLVGKKVPLSDCDPCDKKEKCDPYKETMFAITGEVPESGLNFGEQNEPPREDATPPAPPAAPAKLIACSLRAGYEMETEYCKSECPQYSECEDWKAVTA